jgi:hypothetical protein
MPFDQAIEREWQLFLKLKDGEQSEALRHVLRTQQQ